MAPDQKRQKLIGELRGKLDEIAAVDPQSLARTSDLSPDINFKDAVPHFEEMIDVVKQLKQRDISRLTTQELTKIGSACDAISNHIKNVQDFSLNQNTPGDVCRNLITQIAGAYDAVMNPLLLPLAFTATQATDYAKIEREAKGYHATMKAESEKLAKFIETSKSEAESALAAVKEQAAEAGVSTNAQIFLKDSEYHGSQAQAWLTWTIISVTITFVAAIVSLVAVFYYSPSSTTEAIQYIVSKVIVLSTLSFAILWCARNFKSQKHNQTLNKHRANALMTFKAFVEGTSDIRVKDAILLQASKAAFAGRPTGYDAPETDAQTVNPIVEIIGKTVPEVSKGTG